MDQSLPQAPPVPIIQAQNAGPYQPDWNQPFQIPQSSQTQPASQDAKPGGSSPASQALAVSNPALAAGGDLLSSVAQKLGMQNASNAIGNITSNTASKVGQYVDESNQQMRNATAGLGGAPSGKLSPFPGAANAGAQYSNPVSKSQTFGG